MEDFRLNTRKEIKQKLKDCKELSSIVDGYTIGGSRNYKLDDLLDGSKILRKFLSETKNRKDIHDSNEVKELKTDSIFTSTDYSYGDPKFDNGKGWSKFLNYDDIIFGFGGLDGCSILFSNKEFCVSSGIGLFRKTYIFELDFLDLLSFQERKSSGFFKKISSGDQIMLGNNEIGTTTLTSHKKLNNILNELKTFFHESWDNLKEEKERKIKEEQDIINRIQKEKKERDRIEKEKREEELRIQEIKRKEVLKKDILDFSKEFDTDRWNN